MYRMFRMTAGGFGLLLVSACAAGPRVAPLPPDAGPDVVRAAELQRQCGASRSAMDCYSEQLLAILEQDGVGAAMDALEALADRDPAVAREGHMYAHHIGLAANPSPATVGETFRQCTPSFQSGCYHGVIQAHFATLVGSGAGITPAAVDGLCAEYREAGEDRWLRFQCVHGLGHGLTLLHDFHLPGALAGCDHLSEEWDREGCYGGVFMESIVNATAPHHTVGRPDAGGHQHGTAGHTDADHAAHTSHHTGAAGDAAAHHAGDGGAGHEHAGHGADQHAAHHADGAHADHQAHAQHAPPAPVDEPFPPLDPADPLYPCTVLDDRYLVSCYQMQTSAILFHNGQNVRATAAACDEAPERYRGHCYLSLGRDISAITMQDNGRAYAACSSGDPDYQVWCHIGYTKNLVDLTADPGAALDYCRTVEGAELKQACYHAVGEEIWVLTNDAGQGEEWCSQAEDGHRDHCLRGAGLLSWRDQTER